MDHGRGQTFYADLQDELMDSYINGWNFRGENRDDVCMRLFPDHCRSGSGSGEATTETTQ